MTFPLSLVRPSSGFAVLRNEGGKSVSTSGDDKTLFCDDGGEEEDLAKKGEKMPRIEGSSWDVAADKPIFDQKIVLAIKRSQI